MRAWLLVVLLGCGRIGFDAHGDGGGTGDGIIGDGPVARCTFSDVDVGKDHTCAIDGDGAVFCWGRNDVGQITGSPSGPKTIPTLVTLPAVAVQVAVGRNHTCARVAGDDVYCWGDNSDGQLGIGSTAQPPGIVQVPLGGDTAIDINAGTEHSCIIRGSDHRVLCWGHNRYFAAGDATPDVTLTSPTLIANTTAAGVKLALGHRHTCVTLSTGETTCFGRGEYGQTADPGFNDHAPIVATAIPALQEIAAGGRHTCGIDAAGQLFCWGRNVSGELGRGTSDLSSNFDPGAAIDTNVTSVAAGTASTCEIHDSGRLACFGAISPADGTFASHFSPFDTPITDAKKIALTFWHACAIKNSGELVCWDGNVFGELGRGTRSVTATPVPANIGMATAISAGALHVCAVSGGQLSCWGSNTWGQLGTGTLDSLRAPATVNTGLTTVQGVAAGSLHTCAWGGVQIACWGDSTSGQTGPNATGNRQLTPVLVPITGTPSRVVAGATSSCAITGGSIQCWGANNHGQLGDNSTTNSASPVTVGNITSPTALCTGEVHECAIDNGVLKCWGGNGDGQLGDNSQIDRLQPITVAVANPVAVACGRGHTCALDNTGAVYCWGRNYSGELGLGDFVSPKLQPLRVTLPGGAVGLFADTYGTCAKLGTGKVYCWGDGELGELGTGFFGSSASPIEAPDLMGVDVVELGTKGGCSIQGGVVKCFGDVFMLGNGDYTDAMPMPPLFTCTK